VRRSPPPYPAVIAGSPAIIATLPGSHRRQSGDRRQRLLLHPLPRDVPPPLVEDHLGRLAVRAAVEGEDGVHFLQEELFGGGGEELVAGLARGLAVEVLPLAGDDDVEVRGQAVVAHQALQERG